MAPPVAVTGIRALALLLAWTAVAAGAACGARPASPSACRATAPVRTGDLQVVRADPAESSIRGVLETPGTIAAGQPYHVRWLVDARKASDEFHVQAVREGTGQVYRKAFAGREVSGQLAEFPTELVFPAAGCWDADVFTGTALGSLTFKVA